MLFSKKLTTYKSLEIQTEHDNDIYYFNFEITFKRKCDHAGFMFTITLFNFFFYFDIYDIRHWNDNENRYMKEGESEKINHNLIEEIMNNRNIQNQEINNRLSQIDGRVK